MKAIVLFGSPGSGKGTQAKLLTRRLGIPHISTGDMLRERIRLDGELPSEVGTAMHSGALAPDQLVNRMVEDRLGWADAAAGFVLDGYPRTLAQAGELCRWLDGRGVREVVIYLAVDYNSIIARLMGRRQCPRCGTLYNLVSQPPKVDMRCDRDGEALVVRDDDSETVIRERLEAYERQTRPVLEFLCRAGRRVEEVAAGADPPERVFERICGIVANHDRA